MRQINDSINTFVTKVFTVVIESCQIIMFSYRYAILAVVDRQIHKNIKYDCTIRVPFNLTYGTLELFRVDST